MNLMIVKVNHHRNSSGNFEITFEVDDFRYQDDVGLFCQRLEDAINKLMVTKKEFKNEKNK